MSSKTLAVTAFAGRTCGAVLESSIGSVVVRSVFDSGDSGNASATVLPAGPFDRIVATADAAAAVARILPLPFRDRRRVSQAVGPALEEHVPLSVDDGPLAWDFVGAPGPDGSTVLAAVAMPERLDAATAGLESVGVQSRPQRLVWAPTAILAAYRRAVGEDASFLLLDIGDAGAVVARVEAGRLVALRAVSRCDEETLVRNTAWSLATVAGGQSRVVTGGRDGGRLAAAVTAGLNGLEVESLPATPPLAGAGDFGGRDWRDYTALTGLLLVAAGDAAAPVLDFQSGAGSLVGAAALRDLRTEASPLGRWAAAAAALAVLAVGLDYAQLFAERRALATRAEEIYTTAMPSGSGGVGRRLKMEMRLRELSGRPDTAASGSPLALLAALSRDIPRGLDVVVDLVDHSPPAAKVSGHAASFETVTRMQQALVRGGAFSRVDVKDVHAAVRGDGVEFLLDLRVAEPGGGT